MGTLPATGIVFKRLVQVAVVALVIAACSGQDDSTSPSSTPDGSLGADAGTDRASQEMQSCLEDRGFVVTVEADGSLKVESPDSGVTPAAALAECQKHLEDQGLVPDGDAAPSRTELEELYRAMVGVNECMKAKDFPTEEPPSLEVFIEEEGGWHPYTAVFLGGLNPNGLSQAPAVDIATLQRECPDN